MLSRMTYWRRCLHDYLRYGRGPGRVASRLLRWSAGLVRDPLRRLGLLCRAARLQPDPFDLHSCVAALDKTLEAIEEKTLQATEARNDLGKGIILKPPISDQEKGVLYLTFERQWARLLRSGHAREIARRYDVVLGPSTSPPPHVELLLMTKFWPGRVHTLLSNFDDAPLLRLLSPKIDPVPLLASSWIDPDDFTPHLPAKKDYDLVMLAHFDPVKRHWLLFEALRKLPRFCRVLLMGVPLGGRTESDLLDEARAFGVADRFELVVRPSREEVRSGLARGRVSLVFSRQEGACIAVTESLFADTPVGMFREARVGSKAFINEQTGRLLERRRLTRQLDDFIDKADSYRPREWALQHISCHVSQAVLEAHLRRAALAAGQVWTQGLLPIRKDLVPSYLSARAEAEMRPWYEDFARRYGLLLGPAARPCWQVERTPECMEVAG